MEALNKFLSFVYANWTAIVTCILLVIGITKKTMDFFKKSDKEKLEVIKSQIKETIIAFVEEAEKNHENEIKYGPVKRAEVIEKIFEKYPYLKNVVNQEELISWIDVLIDEALEELREIIELNNNVVIMEVKEG